MNTNRKNAVIIGVCFILATVTSIVGFLLYQPILSGTDYLIQGAAHANQVILGALFELVLVVSNVGTTIFMFPYLRKYNESIALGYLCLRVFEAVVIMIGIISVLSLLSLSREFVTTAASNLSAFQVSGPLLIAARGWTFKLGPNFLLGTNTMMYSFLLYKSKLVPRIISVLGLTGSILVLIAFLLEMFGPVLQTSGLGALLAMPIAVYEMILAVWLITKGFNLSALASTAEKATINEIKKDLHIVSQSA